MNTKGLVVIITLNPANLDRPILKKFGRCSLDVFLEPRLLTHLRVSGISRTLMLAPSHKTTNVYVGGQLDGEPGASYLELVDLLQSRGAHAQEDCRELFRRVVFSILIHNTDDHLRNHGFLLSPEGITLSPVFDINPAIDRNELALAINEVESTCDVAIALEAHRAYGLTDAQAKAIVSKTRDVVAAWHSEATRFRIPRGEQQLMAKAFGTKATH